MILEVPHRDQHRTCGYNCFHNHDDTGGRVAKFPSGHFDEQGQAVMVDIGSKPDTHRIALATGTIKMLPSTLKSIMSGSTRKGDVLGVARLAAIQAAKKTADLIPLAHPLPLTKVAVDFKARIRSTSLQIHVTAETVGKTGVEMEALTAVATGLLTIYDMCKGQDRAMLISDIHLLEKSGGKSGLFRHPLAGPRRHARN